MKFGLSPSRWMPESSESLTTHSLCDPCGRMHSSFQVMGSWRGGPKGFPAPPSPSPSCLRGSSVLPPLPRPVVWRGGGVKCDLNHEENSGGHEGGWMEDDREHKTPAFHPPVGCAAEDPCLPRGQPWPDQGDANRNGELWVSDCTLSFIRIPSGNFATGRAAQLPR